MTNDHRVLENRLARAEQKAERLELQLFNCIGGAHTSHKYTRDGQEPIYCCPAHEDYYDLLEESERLERDLAAARVALKKFGQHLGACPGRPITLTGDPPKPPARGPCTCGFGAVLEGSV